jgi:hypothetical protein
MGAPHRLGKIAALESEQSRKKASDEAAQGAVAEGRPKNLLYFVSRRPPPRSIRLRVASSLVVRVVGQLDWLEWTLCLSLCEFLGARGR